MRNAKLLLVVATGRTGKLLNPRTKALYSTIKVDDTEGFNTSDARIIGPVYFDTNTRKHVVKSATGFSNLSEWLS